MTSFSDQMWETRVAAGGMGDQAEARFESVYPNGWVRTGLNRPPLQVWKLPMRERYRPDYMTSNGYVEVQGLGKKQTMALKIEKYNCLQAWHQIFPVDLFVYDAYYDRHTTVGLRQVDDWINLGKVQLRFFPEGKAYFLIPADVIFAPREA